LRLDPKSVGASKAKDTFSYRETSKANKSTTPFAWFHEETFLDTPRRAVTDTLVVPHQ
jgi:hypothetical protein